MNHLKYINIINLFPSFIFMLYIFSQGESAYFTEDEKTALKLATGHEDELIKRKDSSLTDLVAYFGMYVREKDTPIGEMQVTSASDIVMGFMMFRGEAEVKFTKHPTIKKAFKVHKRGALEDYLGKLDSISQLDTSNPERIEWETKMSSYRKMLESLF